MALRGLLVKQGLASSWRICLPMLHSQRQGHTMRGKRPGVARTLAQRLEEENPIDAELAARVNIGFPKLKPSRTQQMKERLEYKKNQRNTRSLQTTAALTDLLIDLDEVAKDYETLNRPFHLRMIADHYGIFEHLFGAAYFIPRVPLSIEYAIDSDNVMPVYNGNLIKPLEAREAPLVCFDGTSDPITGKQGGNHLWTLIATNPDGNLEDSAKECVHWFVANIPDGAVKEGETVIDYLAPFPPKGIGYQRFIFILYKQEKRLDFSSYKLNKQEYNNLKKRTFKTLDFYREYQDNLTPAGLAFYQTDYDTSLTEFYHSILERKEPIYEYDFPKTYLADQKFFPLRQAFNMYLDRYRDVKEVNKALLERKLSKTHPFNGPEPELRYPMAQPLRNIPSWLRTERRKERLKICSYSDF